MHQNFTFHWVQITIPLTAAQRQAKRRQKLRETAQYEDYKKKNAEQQRLVRVKKQRKEAQLQRSEKNKLQAERRKQVWARVAACQARKKQQNPNNDPTPGSPAFKSEQALGRAVSRANPALGTALPQTLKRKRAVVQRLSQRFQMECGTSPDDVTTRTIARNCDETVDLVKEFYERDDISRQAPGRKDVNSCC